MAPADISDELFLVARGVIFDWALHDGKYDLKSRMERMLDIYLNSITCGDDTPPLPSR